VVIIELKAGPIELAFVSFTVKTKEVLTSKVWALVLAANYKDKAILFLLHLCFTYRNSIKWPYYEGWYVRIQSVSHSPTDRL
jgi:hypothetical protein